MKNIGVDNWDELYALQTLKKLKNYKVLEKGYLKGSNPTMLDLKRWKLGLISNDFNLLSNRVIFKFLHYGFNCVDLLNNLTKSESIALIRHPIAVSLSRTVAPRLSVMLSSEIIDPYLSEKQKQIAHHLQKENDPFINKILEWCVQNKILLNQREKFKTILNYEELVLYPEQIINHLKKKFDLNFEYSEKDYTKASKTTLINSKKQFDKSSIPSKNSNLRLEKWRSKINVEDEKKVFQILDLFEIDFYEFGKNIPNEKFLVL